MNRRHARAAKSEGRRRIKRGWNAFVQGPPPDTVEGAVSSWTNNLYVVLYMPEQTEIGLVERLLIRRNDGTTNVPWAHKQRIKDELLGPERVAVEVMPARSELVDDCNCYHLWGLPEGYAMPFGLDR